MTKSRSKDLDRSPSKLSGLSGASAPWLASTEHLLRRKRSVGSKSVRNWFPGLTLGGANGADSKAPSLPRTPSFTYSEETVRPEHGAGGGGSTGGRPLPSTQTANTLVGGEGSQDASGGGGGGAKGSPASAYSSLGYGRHLSKVGTFQDYIKQQVGGEQQGSYPSAAYYHGVA